MMATAVIGGIVWRIENNGEFQILLGRREKEPDKGLYTICFGGTVEVKEGAMGTLERKLVRETGGDLKLAPMHYLNVYGPSDYRHEPILNSRGRITEGRVTKERIASSKVIMVFWARWKSGVPKDNPWVSDLKFVNLAHAVELWKKLAFDQSRMLIDFSRKIYKF